MALIAAFNEADVIAQVIAALIEEGVEVHLLDHGSNDGTTEAAAPFLGRGLIAIERFPKDPGLDPAEVVDRPWESILRRKQQLATELEADWFIHHDADEFREGLVRIARRRIAGEYAGVFADGEHLALLAGEHAALIFGLSTMLGFWLVWRRNLLVPILAHTLFDFASLVWLNQVAR